MGRERQKRDTLVTCQDSRELFKPRLVSSRQSQRYYKKHSLHTLRPTTKRWRRVRYKTQSSTGTRLDHSHVLLRSADNLANEVQ